ncbi:hypothetical protein G6F24_017664 [Rhizopus arrhizus]|nr:hypothetical protein G6F24_017664 [Rhizopus arrhizus]
MGGHILGTADIIALVAMVAATHVPGGAARLLGGGHPARATGGPRTGRIAGSHAYCTRVPGGGHRGRGERRRWPRPSGQAAGRAQSRDACTLPSERRGRSPGQFPRCGAGVR